MGDTHTAGSGVALVFAGGDPPHPGALDGLARRRAGRGRRLRAAPRASRSDAGSTWSWATSTRCVPTRSHAAERAGRTGGAPPHRQGRDRPRARARRRARSPGARRIVVIGGHGGRIDHFLANVAAPRVPRYRDVRLEARFAGGTVHVGARRRSSSTASPGDLVTLLPVGGAAHGVTTEHLRLPVAGRDAPPGLDAWREQRARARTRPVSPSPTACSSWCLPPATQRKDRRREAPPRAP